MARVIIPESGYLQVIFSSNRYPDLSSGGPKNIKYTVAIGPFFSGPRVAEN
jgi:hypothetical protein